MMDVVDPYLLMAVVAPSCFVAGAVAARLFMSSMRRDQIDVLMSRKMSFQTGATTTAACSNVHSSVKTHLVPDDDEYSEGFDADDIMQATSKAAAMQHEMVR